MDNLRTRFPGHEHMRAAAAAKPELAAELRAATEQARTLAEDYARVTDADTGRYYDNRNLRIAADRADARARELQEQLRQSAIAIWKQAHLDGAAR